MKILFAILLTVTAVISSDNLYSNPAFFDGNCSLAIKDEDKTEKRFTGSFINLLDSEKILIFRINDRIKSIFLSQDVKWEFPIDSNIKKIELLKENKGACIAIDFEIQNNRRTAKKIKILSDYKANRKLAVKYEEIKNLITSKALFIDSRPENIYSTGTIPGAINIPLSKLREDSGKKLLPEDKNALLVFFCSGISCNISFESAAIAAKSGYRNVKVYQDGYPDYLKNNNVYAIQPSYLITLQERKKPFILIDIRKKASDEHIPEAFAVDTAKLDDLKQQLPQKAEYKINAMIIVYGSGEDDDRITLDTAATILSWGYKNVSIINGGFKSYAKSGSAVKRSLSRKIDYSEKESFFISTDEFYAGLIKNSFKDHIFIDLRDGRDINEEPSISALGALKLSFDNIYLNQPKNRLKKYIIYSDSVEKSIEAMELLKQENFNHIQVIKGYIFSDGKGGLLIGDKKIDNDLVRKLKR